MTKQQKGFWLVLIAVPVTGTPWTLSFLTLHKGSIRRERAKNRGSAPACQKAQSESLNSQQNMLLSLINRLGDVYDGFCREWIMDHLLTHFTLGSICKHF